MRLELDLDDLRKDSGLEIGIRGALDNPATSPEHPSQVFVEYYAGAIKVYVWNGESEDPTATVAIPLREN